MDCERMTKVTASEEGFRRVITGTSVADEGHFGRAYAGQALQPHQYQQEFGSEEPWSCSAGAGGGGDELFVDELLALDEISEDPEEEKGEQGEGNGSNDHYSGVSFEDLPPPDPVLPEGDISDLEWVSRFVDDTFMDVPPCFAISPAFAVPKPPAPNSASLLASASASPTVTSATHSRSVSSGSVASVSSPGATAASPKRTWTATFSSEVVAVPSKSRTKRARTGGRVWSLDRPDLLESLCSSAASSSSSSSSSSSLSSCLVFEPQGLMAITTFDYVPVSVPPPAPRGRGRPPLHKKKLPPIGVGVHQNEQQKKPKKKGRKPKSASELVPGEQVAEDGVSGRRCSHCGVQKTPQWRTGPMGAKTLCNACGVRFKSGRLLPEYRPACSPTFVSHIHSNSHRKVLEMRRKKDMQDQDQDQYQCQTVLSPGESFAVSPPPPASPALPAQHLVF